jgi:hypothetical protein|tara:strand:+ start:3542 stop:3802 length:261 start_codon:yes stop_codon:yes gene_type:complete
MTPILIVRMPHDKTEDEVSNVFLDFQESPIMDEYNLLVLKNYTPGETEIRFECINSTHTDIEFEELKYQLLKEMESNQVSRQNKVK